LGLTAAEEVELPASIVRSAWPPLALGAIRDAVQKPV